MDYQPCSSEPDLWFATGLFRGGTTQPVPEVVAVTPGSAVPVAPVPTAAPENATTRPTAAIARRKASGWSCPAASSSR